MYVTWVSLEGTVNWSLEAFLSKLNEKWCLRVNQAEGSHCFSTHAVCRVPKYLVKLG